MKLYQYAVIWNPNEKEKEAGQKSQLVVPITTLLASDEKSAGLQAARAIPEEWVPKLEQCEIALRPF